MIKAIIFDLDGVLVDATEIHYEALNKALGLFGYTITREEHESTYNGLPTRVKLEKLGIPEGLRPFISEMKARYTSEMFDQRLRWDYQKVALVRALRERGYKLFCVSNAIRTSIVQMLRGVGIWRWFADDALMPGAMERYLGNDEGFAPKPEPDLYLEAMKRLEVTPKETVILEDSPHGVAAAKASGARVIEVRGYQDVHTGLFKREGLL